MANKKIREAIKNNGMYLWQLSDILNVSEATVTRWLRHEIPDEKQMEIIEKINQYQKGSIK